uniref:CUB-like domain-containing protein n=1 Tax=Acrobeloides nanus TaxID=290746 RepID=A0A914CCU7_9BILA
MTCSWTIHFNLTDVNTVLRIVKKGTISTDRYSKLLVGPPGGIDLFTIDQSPVYSDAYTQEPEILINFTSSWGSDWYNQEHEWHLDVSIVNVYWKNLTFFKHQYIYYQDVCGNFTAHRFNSGRDDQTLELFLTEVTYFNDAMESIFFIYDSSNFTNFLGRYDSPAPNDTKWFTSKTGTFTVFYAQTGSYKYSTELVYRLKEENTANCLGTNLVYARPNEVLYKIGSANGQCMFTGKAKSW